MDLEKDFTEIYNTHAAKVHRLCLGYASGDNDLAKEWLQETFLKVWKQRKSFKGRSSVGTWIYRIAMNVCLSDLRQKRIHKPINESVLSIQTDVVDENPAKENDDKIEKMYNCISQLGEQNKVLILLELENIPQETIARTVGIAHGAVRTRLSRIRKILLKCITNGK